METKECKDCGEELDVSCFHFADKKRGILKSYCTNCSYKRAQAHIAKDPVAHHYYMKRYYAENPERYPGNYQTKTIPMLCGVYKIDCVLTDDSYIGCSTNIRGRIYKHRKASGRGKQQNLYKLIKQYGWESFNVEVLELCDKEVMFERETFYIQQYKPNLNSNKNK